MWVLPFLIHIYLHNRSLSFLTLLPKISQISHHWSWVTKITLWLGTLFPWVRFPFLSDKNTLQLIPAQIEHACNHFIIHASGYLITVHSDTLLHGQIWLCLQQYTYIYKDYNKNLKPGLKKLLLPLHYIIKPFPQWTTMPKLQVGHVVAVTGFLSLVLQKNDGKIQFFKVEVVRPGQYLGKEVCVGWS